MRSNGLRLTVNLIFLLLPVGYIASWISNPHGYGQEMIVLLICHIFMHACLIVILNQESTYVFEPIAIVFFLYYMIFVFAPIYNICTDNVTELGINTMGGCIKGTIVFMIGFIGMLMGYYSKGCEYFGNSELVM